MNQSFLLATKVFGSMNRQGTVCWYSGFSHVKRKSIQYVKPQLPRFFSDEWDFDVDNILIDKKYKEFSDRTFRLPQHGHNVLVIQPHIKNYVHSESGIVVVEKKSNTTPELQLEEAVALIDTLPRWQVRHSMLLRVPNFNKTTFFGSGQIKQLIQLIREKRNISAVFVSVNILRVKQIIHLEEALKVPVFDRYTIVIQIFRHHAVTSESKLQVAMAEIPYLKQCVKGIPKGLSDRLTAASIIGGTEDMSVETRRELLADRELKLRKALSLLQKHRERLRSNPKKNFYPVVAVVGYTNAGKTSLIKALTGTGKLTPRNQLFATLDVTKHEGTLPCNLKVLFVDTVGFITDIPTQLIESFTATLEDAIHSNVIVHVWDASNPDYVKQREHVLSTLSQLNFNDVEKKMFVVANKVDRISKNALLELQEKEPSTFFVSAKTGFGMEEMLYGLQKKVLDATSRIRMKIRVRTGGEEYDWICREFPVEGMEPESDSNFALVTVVITKSQLEIFKHQFLKQH